MTIIISASIFVFTIATSSVFGQHLKQIPLQGRNETVSLVIDDKLARVLQRFESWKATAAPGLEVDFLLGAGELRRALLGIETGGPGDFELFIHIKNRRYGEAAFLRAMEDLRATGLNLEEDIRHILDDPDKKIDFFIKDQTDLERGRAYLTDKSRFDGRGDTSVNELLLTWNPPLIRGEPENLEALAKGTIEYREEAKTALLARPEGVPNLSGVITYYPSTILRQDFRVTRLRYDVQFARNPNELVLGSSFVDAASGTELYFAEMQDRSILDSYKLYPTDDSYVQQFLKIFRRRSDQELATIYQDLKDRYPDKLSLWLAMGLDAELLSQPRANLTIAQVAKREMAGVISNARYESLRPLVTKALNIRNPFQSETARRDLFRQNKMVDVGLPEEYLRAYSPEVYALGLHFSALDLEEKLRAVSGYLSAVKFFSGSAFARIYQQTSFRDNLIEKFPYADPHRLGRENDQSLLDWLTEMEAVAHYGERTPWVSHPDSYNSVVGEGIEDMIESVKQASGQLVPVVVVDLDNTLFSTGSRYLHILQAYDESRGTNWFEGVELADIPLRNPRAFLYDRWVDEIEDYAELSRRIQDVSGFIIAHQGHPSFVARDLPIQNIVDMVKRWHGMGAELIYLTARPPFQRGASRAAMQKAELPDGELAMFDWSETNAAAWKASVVESLREANSSRRYIAFLDDHPTNINKMNDEFEVTDEPLTDMISTRVQVRHQSGEPEGFLMVDEGHLFNILGSCEGFFTP